MIELLYEEKGGGRVGGEGREGGRVGEKVVSLMNDDNHRRSERVAVFIKCHSTPA